MSTPEDAVNPTDTHQPVNETVEQSVPLHATPDTPSASDTSQDTSEPVLRRHKELWFSDGSIILRAQDVLFRVHMSQLSRRSLLFHDMFTLPQAPFHPPGSSSHGQSQDANDMIEGCPVIELFDNAEDLSNLLFALYDGPYVSNQSDKSDLLMGNMIHIEISGQTILRIFALYQASFDYLQSI